LIPHDITRHGEGAAFILTINGGTAPLSLICAGRLLVSSDTLVKRIYQMPVGASAASQERAEKVTEGFISGGEDGADEDLVDAELILAASATTIHFVVDRHNAALLRRISRENIGMNNL
jgi:hypothetical protein